MLALINQAPTREKDQIESMINDSLRCYQQVDINDVFENIGEVLGRWVTVDIEMGAGMCKIHMMYS